MMFRRYYAHYSRMRLPSGGDLKSLYVRLQAQSGALSSISDLVNFFNKFVSKIVTEMYNRSVWSKLTARKRIRNNEYIDFDAHHVINFVRAAYPHSKKEIPKTFYVDVFNMITVALTNFRRNLKNQAFKEEYLNEQRAESGSQTANEEPLPDRASTTSPAVMYDAPRPSQSSAFTALSFSDYSQE